MFDTDRIWETVIAVLLTTLGGLARLLYGKERGKTKTKRLGMGRVASELFISAFCGFMVLLLARIGGLSGDWIGLVCGIAGWVGPHILDLVFKPVGKALGLDVDGVKSDGGENEK